MNGLFNEMTYFNGVPETVPDMLKHYDELGGPMTYPHMAAGWAVAGDTPFTWTKQVASDFGGTRNGMVVHWPKGIKAKERGALAVASRHRRRADGAGGGGPAGAEERERDGADADRRREHALHVRRRQGDEPAHDAVLRDLRQSRHLPRRLVRRHHSPGARGSRSLGGRSQDDIWELYDTRTDFSLANDLAAKNPAKLKELQALFLKEAVEVSRAADR